MPAADTPPAALPATPPAAPALRDLPTDVIAVTNLVRTGRARTRQTIAEHTGMGRNTVSSVLSDAVDAGLLTHDGSAPSTGGRAPDRWRFRHEAGAVMCMAVHSTTLRLAITDLAGNNLTSQIVDWPITNGPDATLDEGARRLRLMAAGIGLPVWCAGVSLIGPINQATGRPVAPPIMPGWDDFDVVGALSDRLGVPVAVDNDVNTMLAGYVYSPQRENTTTASASPSPSSSAPLSVPAPSQGEASSAERPSDLLYIQIGTGIGAGIRAGGFIHHGADGAAGDIGHVRVASNDSVPCRCGRAGCLEAVAGGWAVLRDARRAAAEGLSPFLRQRLTTRGELSIDDVVDGVTAGDTECVTLMVRSASAVGDALAMIVSFFNPARVILAGPMPQGCPMFLDVVRRIVTERALGLATDSLEIEVTSAGMDDERRGTAVMAVWGLFRTILA